MYSLTKQQFEVLNLILNGFETTEIASKLHRTEKSIDNARSFLLQTFNSRTTIGMIVEAMKYGFLNCSINLFENKPVLKTKQDFLSLSEATVLFEILSGKTSSEIANHLNCSKTHVDVQRANISRKWKVTSKVDFVKKAYRKNYLIISPTGVILNPDNKDAIWRTFKNYIKIDDMPEFRPIFKISYSFPRYAENNLSIIQQKILKMRFEGRTNDEIGVELKISKKTVSNYFMDAKKQLKAVTETDLMIKSISMGIISIHPVHNYKLKKFSDQEFTLLLFLFESLSYQEIAHLLNVSTTKISSMVRRMKSERNVNTISGLLLETLKRGEINLDMITTTQELNFTS